MWCRELRAQYRIVPAHNYNRLSSPSYVTKIKTDTGCRALMQCEERLDIPDKSSSVIVSLTLTSLLHRRLRDASHCCLLSLYRL